MYAEYDNAVYSSREDPCATKSDLERYFVMSVLHNRLTSGCLNYM